MGYSIHVISHILITIWNEFYNYWIALKYCRVYIPFSNVNVFGRELVLNCVAHINLYTIYLAWMWYFLAYRIFYSYTFCALKYKHFWKDGVNVLLIITQKPLSGFVLVIIKHLKTLLVKYIFSPNVLYTPVIAIIYRITVINLL